MKCAIVKSGINVPLVVPLRSQFHFVIVTGALVLAEFFRVILAEHWTTTLNKSQKSCIISKRSFTFWLPPAIHEKEVTGFHDTSKNEEFLYYVLTPYSQWH